MPLSVWFSYPLTDWRESKWVWLVTISRYKIYFLNMQRFFLSKTQYNWGMKHCLPDLSEIQKIWLWFFGQLCYWQIHFLSTTYAEKTSLIIFLVPWSFRSFSMIYRGGKMKEKQKLAVHYAALGKEDDGFSQSNFLQSEIWYKDLDYVCQCWEGTQTCETIIYNQCSQGRGHYWVLEIKSISTRDQKGFFRRVGDSNI